MALPGERIVYIEADPEINADGIPPQSLLDDAREYIQYEMGDTENGKTNEVLGNVDELLQVLPITRRGFYVLVTNLEVQVGNIADAQTDISMLRLTVMIR
jgi:hypothetical protein